MKGEWFAFVLIFDWDMGWNLEEYKYNNNNNVLYIKQSCEHKNMTCLFIAYIHWLYFFSLFKEEGYKWFPVSATFYSHNLVEVSHFTNFCTIPFTNKIFKFHIFLSNLFSFLQQVWLKIALHEFWWVWVI